jgi:hypothetical protein
MKNLATITLIALSVVYGLTCAPTVRAAEPCGARCRARSDASPRPRFAGCEQVQRERDGHCLTTLDGHPTVLGLETGRLCPIDTELSFSAPSFAWRGDAIAFCSDLFEGVVAIGSLASGDVTPTTVPCSAVTGYADGILVRPPFWLMVMNELPYTWYRDARSLLRGRPDASYASIVHDDWAIGTNGDRLLSAWHSTDTLEVLDLRNESRRDPIVLERADDWIQGLAGVSADRIALLGGILGDRLEIFSTSGEAISEKDLSPGAPAVGLFAGLVCATPATHPARRLAYVRQ